MDASWRESGTERVAGFGAGVVGAVLTPVVWLVVGPRSMSTVSADGRVLDESAGMVRVFAALVVVDLVVALGWWRRWLTVLGATVGAGLTWTALAFAVTATSRVSGANMAGLWVVVGPVVVGTNSALAAGAEHIGRAVRRRRRR